MEKRVADQELHTLGNVDNADRAREERVADQELHTLGNNLVPRLDVNLESSRSGIAHVANNAARHARYQFRLRCTPIRHVVH